MHKNNNKLFTSFYAKMICAQVLTVEQETDLPLIFESCPRKFLFFAGVSSLYM